MPPGSLGRLLDLGRQLAALQRTDRPEGRPALVAVFAADHGVAEAGVSAYPAEVTGQMVANYLRGGAAVNVLARRAGASVRVADLGVAHLARRDRSARVLDLAGRFEPGTSNFLEGPAMSRAEAFRAVEIGLELADDWVGRSEMPRRRAGRDGDRQHDHGGNPGLRPDRPRTRTAWSAGARAWTMPVTAASAARSPPALARHAPAIADDWDWLARVGGFEILGLAGLAIGAARERALVVLDGLISSTAGLIAARLCPTIRARLVAAHLEPRAGPSLVLDALGLRPLLDLGLRLGEGTGAALALPMIASAADILREMATFDSARVSGPNQ